MTEPGPKPPTHAELLAPEVARRVAAGAGRNEIARDLGVSTGTVSRAARLAGVSFDVGPTATATATRAQQVAATRRQLADMAADNAARAGRRLRAEIDAPVLDVAAVRALSVAFGVSTDKALALHQLDPPENSREVQARAALDGLMTAVLTAADHPSCTSTTPTDQETP